MDMVSERTKRTIKFTPERMEQIRNLLERGLNREQIAELIGVTVGSLAVTCSRHGISLRTRRDAPSQSIKEKSMSEENASRVAQFEITVGHRKIHCEVPLRAFIELCFEAQMTNAKLGDVIAKKLQGKNDA